MDVLEQRLRTAELFDLYGALLTEKQQRCVTMHFFEDFSLSEIGDALGISRQAVYDMLKRAEESLHAYETRLGLWTRQMKRREALDRVYDALEQLTVTDEAAREQVLTQLLPFTGRESSYHETVVGRRNHDI